MLVVHTLLLLRLRAHHRLWTDRYSGLNWLIPIVDRIAYVQNLKDLPIEVSPQTAITTDNVGIEIDGVLYIRVVDPYKASYGVDDAVCEWILVNQPPKWRVGLTFGLHRRDITARADDYALRDWVNDAGSVVEGARDFERKDHKRRQRGN